MADDNQQQPPKDDVPFGEPDDVGEGLGKTHPQTDSNIDPDEAYHEGLAEASEVFDPEKNDATDDDNPILMDETH